MCGIAGIVEADQRPASGELLKHMCDQLRHRGPDDEGYYLDQRVGLGQRRLSIIDLCTGRQPQGNEDGTVWVTFNGEIYNFQQVRAELQALGHRFATQSDTEVIIHAYEEDGADCLQRFRGMFAFALWDTKEQRLLLARDRIGKKPLFYTWTGQQFVFASELQALLVHPAVRPEPDITAIDDYLTYGYIPAPKTGFRGIHKLLPAHYLELSGDQCRVDQIQVHRYWRLDYTPKLSLREDEAVEGLLGVLRESVRLRLIADVPLGALLSGGVDSSVVVALMSQLTDQPVKTFSIGFREQDFNELPYARAVAERYGTDHHELEVRPKAIDILPTLVRHYGEPFADWSAIPSYYVSKLTRAHVKVALNGDGGDECFAGYERYLASSLINRYRMIPSPVRHGLIEPLTAMVPNSRLWPDRMRQVKSALQVASSSASDRYMRWITFFRPDQKDALYTSAFRESLEGYDGPNWLAPWLDEVPSNGRDELDVILATDVESYLPNDLLVKMDIASMANSLETRSPFLDHHVMEFCARLPSKYKIRGTSLKYLLKQASKRLIPDENIHRRKMGFGVPVGQWMREDLRPLLEDTLFSTTAQQRGYFQPAAVRTLVDNHVSGTSDHSSQLWALLCLELWLVDIGY